MLLTWPYSLCLPNLDKLPVLAKLIVELEKNGIEKHDWFIVLGTIFVTDKYLLEAQIGMNRCYLDHVARLKSYFKKQSTFCNVHV
jgi:hypothetical protein